MRTSGFVCAALVGVATVSAQDTANLNFTILSSTSATFKEVESASSIKEDTTKQLGFEGLQDQTQQEQTELQDQTQQEQTEKQDQTQEDQTERQILMPASAPTAAPAPTPDLGPFIPTWIALNEVRPYIQPKPKTISEKAAVKFKPKLRISTGCHSYAAVNEAGELNGGLNTTGSSSSKCKGSGYGSQVYGRSTWFGGRWAIMYSWYFPKKSASPGVGHCHDWENVVVWLDNPAVENATILACSPSAHDEYSHKVPPKADTVSGTSIKVKAHNNTLSTTHKEGDSQYLIMWDQLTENSRRALNCVSWGDADTPMSDANFEDKLKKAWPFG